MYQYSYVQRRAVAMSRKGCCDTLLQAIAVRLAAQVVCMSFVSRALLSPVLLLLLLLHAPALGAAAVGSLVATHSAAVASPGSCRAFRLPMVVPALLFTILLQMALVGLLWQAAVTGETAGLALLGMS
jgi:hypothetical protein